MKVRFVGDIHGNLLDYIKIIDSSENSIQVGDFGIGFGTRGDPDFVDSMLNEIKGNHRFIRGNHDNPSLCKGSKYWIKDGTIEKNIMFIGGAWSIDQQWRTTGIDWWPDEELSMIELDTLIGMYDFIRPEIMVTHTFPISIPRDYFGKPIFGQGCRTEWALERMLEVHKPNIWIGGHWHLSYDYLIDKTRFICLNELEYIDLEI